MLISRVFPNCGNNDRWCHLLALQSRAAKRTTLTWTDFSSSGFSRNDAPLSATLQFSSPLVNSISSWPEQQADITRKLKKTQKSLPPFGWDTEPVMGAEVVIEEAFVDVFCDLVYGGGWMDIEREDVDRECNWALVSIAVVWLTPRRPKYISLRRSNSRPSRYRGLLFLAARTHVHPRPSSSSRSLCLSNTVNSSPRVSRTKERCPHSSLRERPSSGNKLLHSTGVLMSSVTCPEASIHERSNLRVYFAATITLRNSSRWATMDL